MTAIAMTVFSYYPADPRVRREAEVLARAGIEVDVVCLRKEGEAEKQGYGPVTAYRVMRGTDRKESLLRYFLLSSAFGLLAFSKIAALSSRRRYCLLQVHNMPDHLVLVGLLHKLAGVPVVLDLHDLTVELFETKTSGRPMRALMPLVRAAEKLSCALADNVITTSPGFRQRLVDRGTAPDKITLVLNSADTSLFPAGPERRWEKIERGPTLLYHGTVARRFGLHVAIEAVDLLRRTMPDTRLSIHGRYDPSYRDELASFIGNKGLGENVALLDYLPLDRVAEEISRHDMGLAPYLSDPFMNLALSTKVFEYVCTGLPVVASRLDSLKEVFDENSLKYFTPGDPHDLASHIRQLCASPEDRRRRAESAARAYEGLSWAVMSKRYLDTVLGLVAGKTAHAL